MSNHFIYLDHAATTPVDPRVLEAMMPYFNEKFGNPSSLHSIGQQAKKAQDSARKEIATILGCAAQEVVFTGSGTESDNLAILGIAKAYAKRGKHIITTKIEHPAVLEACQHLEKNGFKITYLPVDNDGLIQLDDLGKALTKETILVSIIYANNEIGTIQPISEIAALLKKHSNPELGRPPIFHTDACQAACSLDIQVDSLGVDLMTLNAGKIYGPKGIGLLYVRKGTKIEPLIYGGGHEFGLRSGTENIPAIVGFATALKLAQDSYQKEAARLTSLRGRLLTGLQKLPDIILNGHAQKRLSNNLNLTIKGVEGETLVIHLDTAGIAASSGSACSSGKTEPSHVLLALGHSKQEAYQSLRFSLGRSTTKEDIDQVIEQFTTIINEARQESGTY